VKAFNTSTNTQSNINIGIVKEFEGEQKTGVAFGRVGVE